MGNEAVCAPWRGIARLIAMVSLAALWASGCAPSSSGISGDAMSPPTPGGASTAPGHGSDSTFSGFKTRDGVRIAQVVERSLPAPRGGATIVHEVGPLETIWRVSRMYDVPVDAIARANSLNPGDPLKIGQRLTIPNAKSFRNVIALYPSSKWTYIIVHHTATEIGKAALINQAHNDRGFLQGLGYDFLIDNGSLGKGDGQIETSPRWTKQLDGAHCKAGGMNFKGIGIALVGNFDHETPTSRQIDSLGYLVGLLMAFYDIPASHVMGHRDVPGASTDCPGTLFPWATVRQSIASYRISDAAAGGRR